MSEAVAGQHHYIVSLTGMRQFAHLSCLIKAKSSACALTTSCTTQAGSALRVSGRLGQCHPLRVPGCEWVPGRVWPCHLVVTELVMQLTHVCIYVEFC
jgi:hypothetical protein